MRPDDRSGFEIVDAHGLLVAKGLLSRNSAAAILNMLDGYIRRNGVCLVHLTERAGARCLACEEVWPRSMFSAVPR